MWRRIAPLLLILLLLGGWDRGNSNPTHLGVISNGGYIPSMVDATNLQQNGRFCRYARTSGTKFRVVITNWYVVQGGAETNTGGTLTINLGAGVNASVNTPGSLTRVGWTNAGGSSSSLVAADGATVESDDINISFNSGDLLCASCLCTSSAARPFGINNLTTALGDALNVAPSGLSDLSLGGTITNNSSTNFFSVFFVAQTSQATAGIGGDSECHGTGDTVDITGDMGTIARSIGPTTAYLNLCVGSDQAHLFVLSHAKRAALVNAYATTYINAYGRNDLNASRTAAQLETDMTTISGFFPTLKTQIATTLAPTSTSSDSWATTANQTQGGDHAQRTIYNTAVRANLPWASHFSEVANVMEFSDDIWNVTGSAFGYTADGVHGNHAMALLVKGTTDPAWIQ